VLDPRNIIGEPESPEDAREIQIELARELKFGTQFRNVAGVVVRVSKDDKRAYVAATVVSTTNWRPISQQLKVFDVERPYDPELLGWRVGEFMVGTLRHLPVEPDVIFVEGNGIAHPRKFGLASHVGYRLDHPTIGVAPLWPRGCRELPATVEKRRGSKTVLLHELSGDPLGHQVYTQINEDPIFVSPGHRISVDEATNMALRCSPWFRMPQPILEAEKAAVSFLKESEA